MMIAGLSGVDFAKIRRMHHGSSCAIVIGARCSGKACANRSTSRTAASAQLAWDADAPPLHFAHANGFNAQTYRGLLEPLGGAFRIVASDARGHGFTTLPTTPGTAQGWTIFRDDLDRVVPDGVILAGHSLGATASLMLAALKPEKVRALVLIEPVLVPKSVAPGDNEMARRAEKRRDVFASLDEAFALYRGRGAFKTWQDETLRDYLPRRIGTGRRRHAPFLPPGLGGGGFPHHAARRIGTRRAPALSRDAHSRLRRNRVSG